MTQFGVGLFTIRRLDEPLHESLRRVADLGYDGAEFVDRVNREMNRDAVAEALVDTGLEPLGAHVWLHQLEDELDELVDRYAPLGVDTFVVPYHPETNFRNQRRTKRIVERLRSVSTSLQDRGFELLYHPNHWDLIPMFDGPVLGSIPPLRVTDRVTSVSQDLRLRERGDESLAVKLGRGIENEILRRRNSSLDRAFIASGATTDNRPRTLAEETPLGFILSETDPAELSLQLDVSFLLQQGYDPSAVLSSFADRVASVHAKDVKPAEYTPGGWPAFVDAGDGELDFERVVRAATDNDIEWVIFENGHAKDPVRSIQGGIDALRSAEPREVNP